MLLVLALGVTASFPSFVSFVPNMDEQAILDSGESIPSSETNGVKGHCKCERVTSHTI